nr:MAG TPA: hypothetical protein [Myoviridae sp. ctNPX13]
MLLSFFCFSYLKNRVLVISSHHQMDTFISDLLS